MWLRPNDDKIGWWLFLSNHLINKGPNMSTLWLEFWTEDEDFCSYAETDQAEKEVRLAGQAAAIRQQFATIYTILEEKQTQKAQRLAEHLHSLSAQLLAPFAPFIQQCSHVRLIVFADLVRCAFDLLLFEGRYLFLQRSISYQVVEGYGDEEPTIELGSALLIADLTADPEEGCRQVAKLIPEAEYVVMADADLAMIKEAAAEVDALIISAHGEVEEDNRGALYLNEQALSAKLIGKLAAWLVYFDACQQGVNLRYLDAFQAESDTQFYLAPIISNDAGDSSTKTLLWFFTELRTHRQPIRALFATRQRLFTFYDQQRLDIVTTLNKAFPFRLYEFVEEDDE